MDALSRKIDRILTRISVIDEERLEKYNGLVSEIQDQGDAAIRNC